jgi:hypothetical protein
MAPGNLGVRDPARGAGFFAFGKVSPADLEIELRSMDSRGRLSRILLLY